MSAKRMQKDGSRSARQGTDGRPAAGRDGQQQPVNRRRALRLLSGLAAAAGAAGIAATQMSEPVRATSGGGDQGYLALGSNPWYIAGGDGNTPAISSAPTVIQASPNFGNFIGINGGAPVLFEADASTSSGGNVHGILGVGRGSGAAGVNGFTGATDAFGVFGLAPDGTGVFGQNGNAGAAVLGINNGNGPGVLGSTFNNSSAGVQGTNGGSGMGVKGTTSSGVSAGVEGDNTGSGPGVLGHNIGSGPGLLGSNSTTAQAAILGSNAGGGPGVSGFATGSASVGLAGSSDTGYGFFGGATGTGIGALVLSPGGVALVARQTNNGLAGYFQGSVIISGSSTVMGAKSAAVKGADGTLRRLYSLESPESWFEDFGSGQLSGGTATVQLEPGFAGVVHSDDFHVFLTPEGDSKGMYVSSKTPAGFTVHEQQGGTSSVGFSYRIVAKRRDIAGARLERVDEPVIPRDPVIPKPPPAPPAPAAPPARPARMHALQ